MDSCLEPNQVMPLFDHQRTAANFAFQNKHAALWHDPGLGKTRTALTVFDMHRENDHRPLPEKLALFVFCPISLIEAAWHSDLKKFFGNKYVFINAHDHGLVQEADIIAINYEFLTRAEKMVRLMAFLKASRRPWMAVLDESSRLKNPKSVTTKALLSLASWFDYRIVMSGTPAPNSEMEYWAQMQFVSPSVFPTRFPQFKNQFFHLEAKGQRIETQGMIMNRVAMQELYKRGAEYQITDTKKKELFSRMAPWIHAAKKEECLDLPEQIDESRFVEMGPKQKRAYKEMKNELITEIQNDMVVAQVALTKVMKLREITSGFAIGASGPVELNECPKMDALKEILDELGDRQVIIWCQFVWEIDKICGALTSWSDKGVANKPWASLYGATMDREDSINGFISGKYQYLVAHPASAAHGLTFVNCSHQIFFSMDYSWERYEQARARTHRAGQKSTCIYYHIMAKDTIDEQILEALRHKGDMQEIIFHLGDAS